MSSLGLPLFVAIFIGHENGDKQGPNERRHMQGMLDETDPLTVYHPKMKKAKTVGCGSFVLY